MPPERVQRCLDELEVQPVLTAHPTEAKRRAVLSQLWRVGHDLEHPDEALEALWQTEEIRERHIGPLQEVESTLYYFDRTIFETVANFYATFDAELAAHFPTLERKRPFLTFASWVGGDRDGNPSVTPDVSRTTMQWHTCVVMDFYERECAKLVEGLSPTPSSGHAAPARAAPASELSRFSRSRFSGRNWPRCGASSAAAKGSLPRSSERWSCSAGTAPAKSHPRRARPDSSGC